MKTYKKTVDKPKLVIQYDQDPESPRQWSNLGYFITAEGNYRSPDEHDDFLSIIKETGEVATSTADHIVKIKQATDEKVVAIYPVTKYEHSGVSYSLGTAHGFDHSNCGFYIITKKSQKEIGTAKKDFEKVMADELDTYNKWVNGEVYGFILYDDDGEQVDSCWGFYDIDDIKDYLPDEWKDENLQDYLI